MEDYNYLFENEDLKILSQEEHIKQIFLEIEKGDKKKPSKDKIIETITKNTYNLKYLSDLQKNM